MARLFGITIISNAFLVTMLAGCDAMVSGDAEDERTTSPEQGATDDAGEGDDAGQIDAAEGEDPGKDGKDDPNAADTQAPTPGASGILTATNFTTTGFDVQWTAATDDKSPAAKLTYEVRRSSTANMTTPADAIANGTLVGSPLVGGTGVQLTGLTPGTTYHVTVLVMDEADNKAVYETKMLTTFAPPDTAAPLPGASGLIAASNVGAGSLKLSWTKGTDNLSDAANLRYEVRRSENDDISSLDDVVSNGDVVGTEATDIGELVVTGLAPSTTYYFNVVVKDEQNNLAVYSRLMQATTADTTDPVPGNSGTLTATSVGATSMTINWVAATDDVTATGPVSYQLFRSTTNNIATDAAAIANGTPVGGPITGTQKAVTGLDPATTYYFNVVVEDQEGNDVSYTMKSQATAADTTPPVPGGSGIISAANVDSDRLDLSWTAATDDVTAPGDLAYEVRRSTSNNMTTVATAESNGVIVKAYTDAMTSAAAKGLRGASTYYFTVIVKDVAGNKAVFATKSQLMAAPHWRHPSTLADALAQGGEDTSGLARPYVAAASAEHAIMAYHVTNATEFHQFRSDFRSGEWTHPADFNDTLSIAPAVDLPGAHTPVAAAPNGDAVIAFTTQVAGGISQIFIRERRHGVNGGNWVDPSDLTTSAISPPGISAGDPVIAMASDGTTIIAYSGATGGDVRTYISEYRGGAWTHSTAGGFISMNSGYSRPFGVAMDDDGNAILLWGEHNGSYFRLFKSEYRSGSWTHPTTFGEAIAPLAASDVTHADVSMDDNGNGLVVWGQHDGMTNFRVYKAEYRSGAWSFPTSLSDHMPPGPLGYNMVDAAMSNDGTAVVIWCNSTEAYKAEYRAGAWSFPAVGDKFVNAFVNQVSVGMDDQGNAVALYTTDVSGTMSAVLREYRGGSWSAPQPVNVSTNNAGHPTVSVAKDGTTVMTWVQSSPTYMQPFFSEYR